MSVLFLGIELSEAVKGHLCAYRTDPSRHIKPVNPELFHITLHYLGELKTETIRDEVLRRLAEIEVAPFEITISSLGHFGRKQKPSVLWAGLEPSEALSNLHSALFPAVEACGVKIDSRRYHPHITLARGRWRSKPVRQDHQVLDAFYNQHFASITCVVDSFVLFESQRTEQGRAYPVIQRFPLAEG